MTSPSDTLSDPTARLSRLAMINAALRRLDPDAQVALEAASGRMKVLTVLPEAEVVRILRELGEPATLSTAADDAGAGAGADADADACCGCGCRGGQG